MHFVTFSYLLIPHLIFCLIFHFWAQPVQHSICGNLFVFLLHSFAFSYFRGLCFNNRITKCFYVRMVAYQRFRIFVFCLLLLLFSPPSSLFNSLIFHPNSFLLFVLHECVKSEDKMIPRLKLYLYLFFTLEITYRFLIIIYHNSIIYSSVCNKFHNLPLPHIWFFILAPFIHCHLKKRIVERMKIITNF